MFEITFTESTWIDEGVEYGKVRLNLNDSLEFETADLTHWSASDYERQWVVELSRICNSRDKGALIVSIHDPAVAYRIWTWTMWRQDEKILFQNRILFMLEPANEFDADHVHDYIGEYESFDEDGRRISEWNVPIAVIKVFLEERHTC